MNISSIPQTQTTDTQLRGPNKQLRNARKALLLSPRELAHKADVSHVTIARLELGLCEPRERTKRQLAEALEVDVELLWP